MLRNWSSIFSVLLSSFHLSFRLFGWKLQCHIHKLLASYWKIFISWEDELGWWSSLLGWEIFVKLLRELGNYSWPSWLGWQILEQFSAFQNWHSVTSMLFFTYKNFIRLGNQFICLVWFLDGLTGSFFSLKVEQITTISYQITFFFERVYLFSLYYHSLFYCVYVIIFFPDEVHNSMGLCCFVVFHDTLLFRLLWFLHNLPLLIYLVLTIASVEDRRMEIR